MKESRSDYRQKLIGLLNRIYLFTNIFNAKGIDEQLNFIQILQIVLCAGGYMLDDSTPYRLGVLDFSRFQPETYNKGVRVIFK